MTEDQEEIHDMALHFVSTLFETSGGCRVEEVLQAVGPSVSDEVNAMLCAEVTMEEVRRAPSPRLKDRMELILKSNFY